MSFGWYLLSAVFVYKMPDRQAAEYTTEAAKNHLGDKRDGKDLTAEDYATAAQQKYERDMRQWATLYSLAGSGGPDPKLKDEATKDAATKEQAAKDALAKSKTVAADATKPQSEKDMAAAEASSKEAEAKAANARLANLKGAPPGKLRTMPWNEPRGVNPFLFAMGMADAPATSWVRGVKDYLFAQVPVLTEPLNKLFLIITKLADPDASFQTRVFLLLCLIWSIAVWAFFGGVITRMAAVQFGGKERISFKQAINFVKQRYISYLLSPLVPLIVIAVIVLCMSLYGLIALVPILGDIIMYGLLLPLIILGGIVITILLIGLVGYPMMNATVSTEGSDTFDALSRSYNYVFQAPWQYLWYIIVSVVYGVFVTFVVLLIGCLMVYFGKWAVSQPATVLGADGRKPEFLFVYSPKSLGWRELMLKGSPAEIYQSPTTGDYLPVDPVASAEYHKQMSWYNEAGAGLVTFWMVLVFLLMIGFIYSYFWTSSTMIYLLMRKKVDEVDIEEVFSQQDAEGVTPPIGPPGATVSSGGAISLPTVPPPPAGPASPPPVITTPPTEAPFFPNTGSTPPKDVPPPPDEPKL
jgi:hypothetical protein